MNYVAECFLILIKSLNILYLSNINNNLKIKYAIQGKRDGKTPNFSLKRNFQKFTLSYFRYIISRKKINKMMVFYLFIISSISSASTGIEAIRSMLPLPVIRISFSILTPNFSSLI